MDSPDWSTWNLHAAFESEDVAQPGAREGMGLRTNWAEDRGRPWSCGGREAVARLARVVLIGMGDSGTPRPSDLGRLVRSVSSHSPARNGCQRVKMAQVDWKLPERT